jgi:hypothetical protein
MTQLDRIDDHIRGVLYGLPKQATKEEKREALKDCPAGPQFRTWRKDWQRRVEEFLKPVPKVRARKSRVDCGWCGGKGCAACFAARQRAEEEKQAVEASAE